MRIGVDARELSGRATGAGRYLGGLLLEWARSTDAARHEFVLYAADSINLELDARRFATRLVAGSSGTWWEQVRLPRSAQRDHLDVWFAPAYTAPLLLGIPTVVAIHDVSFAAHPEWFRLREGVRRRWITQQSANRAHTIITISEFSKREIVAHLGAVADKIHVVPPGVGTRDWGPGSSSSQSPAASPYRVLYVGSIFNRRHVIDLIRAFAPIARAHPGATLDIVGDNRSHPREDLPRAIASEGLQTQVHWHQYVSNDQLQTLYAQAHVFVFLSEYEGLGLTPLEALAAGVPPVLLDTPVAHETCGDAAMYVPPHDVAAVTRAIETLLLDQTKRSTLLDAAPAVLAKYSWPRSARDTLAVLQHTAVHSV
jgi:glycosyltransferase involved in cell wall biosynthesis